MPLTSSRPLNLPWTQILISEPCLRTMAQNLPVPDTPVPPEAQMEVDQTNPPGLEGPGKRPRSGSDQYQEAEEELIPTEPAPPVAQAQRALTLQDLMDAMTAGFAGTNTKMDRMSCDIGEAKREATEAKEMAAKATTIAHDTQTNMRQLEERLVKLETAIHQIHPGLANSTHPDPKARPDAIGIFLVAMGVTPLLSAVFANGQTGTRRNRSGIPCNPKFLSPSGPKLLTSLSRPPKGKSLLAKFARPPPSKRRGSNSLSGARNSANWP